MRIVTVTQIVELWKIVEETIIVLDVVNVMIVMCV